MGIYFKKSINFGLFRINFSTSGVSLSFGIKGARFCLGPKGLDFNGGTNGVYYKKRLCKTQNKKKTKV